MKRSVVYLRVSTAEQVEGTSLETQRRTCEEYCKRNDMDVVRYFEDRGESAKTTDRPEFQKMLRMCSDPKQHIDIVLAYRLDRLARNNFDYAVFAGALAKYGASIRSATEPVTDDPTGRFMQTVLSAIAELDNSVRGERAKDGMMRVAEKGGWAFKAPLGYTLGRDTEAQPILIEHPEQGPLIREMYQMAKSGLHTLTDIQQAMIKRGWKRVFGVPLHLQRVQRVLTNPIHCGRITGKLVGGRVIKARFKTIMDERTFDRVQAILTGQGHEATPHDRNNEAFPLRQFVLCGSCQSPLTASFSRGGAGGRYPYYRCRNRQCLAVHIKRDALENAFRQHLTDSVTVVTTPKLKLFRETILNLWKTRHVAAITEQAAQRKRAGELEDQQRRLVDKLVKGVITDEVYQAKAAELSAEIAISRVEGHDAELDSLDIEGVLNCAEYLFRNTAAIWDKLDLDNRQRFQKVLFPSGLTYTMDQGFGTSVTSLFIKVLQQNSGGESRMARPPGVEPGLPG